MTAHAFLNTLPHLLVLYPSAASCYFSAAHQMRFSVRKTALLCCAVLTPFTLIASYLCAAHGLDTNLFALPMLVLCYFLFRRTVTVSTPKAIAIYTGVCAVQSFPSQFACALDAYLHPDSGAAALSDEAALFQLVISCLIVALAAYPATHLFPSMVDQLDVPAIWHTLTALSSLVLLFNIVATPVSYQTIHTGRIGYLFPVLELFLLVLLIAIYVLFYFTSTIIHERGELRARTYLMETQARQYETLRTHLRETERLRHDFRHSVHVLASLAQQGDMEKLRAYLSEYEGQLAGRAPVNFCANDALNALFGYYKARAEEAQIQTEWRIELPEPLCFSELDLAALFGNLLENAIAGCARVPAASRYFYLTTQVQHDGALYVVSTNSFDGSVRKGPGGYLSTKHAGEGVGLPSIAAVAEKYHGSVRISHRETEFFVDIVMQAKAG